MLIFMNKREFLKGKIDEKLFITYNVLIPVQSMTKERKVPI